ncbi:helix-turn-helix domain-containing protein [Thalassobacillus devorans]|uniref:helix-turn-helix domain-containing protein n=1 Tax=Thalassobacillus devorans TaxID=279813 RepID=UPI000A1CC43D|nr:helix-turn-helix transcriptional regulator [Thalassobacillus devorans]
MDVKTLKIVRKALGINQARLAREVGVGLTFISQLEAGYKDIPPGRKQLLREALPVTDEEIAMLIDIHDRLN